MKKKQKSRTARKRIRKREKGNGRDREKKPHGKPDYSTNEKNRKAGEPCSVW